MAEAVRRWGRFGPGRSAVVVTGRFRLPVCWLGTGLGGGGSGLFKGRWSGNGRGVGEAKADIGRSGVWWVWLATRGDSGEVGTWG